MSLNTFGERRMSRTKTFLAGWKGVALLSGLLLVLVLVLAGCGGEPPAVPAEPTEVVAAPTEPLAPPPTHTPAPTEEPTPEVVDDTGCITCHTDEEILKSLAKEPEEAESLSEGEG
jgi:hypothetical protein